MEPRSRHRATLTLPSDTEILIVRQFDAPKQVVFDAWSTPALVSRWYGCPDMTVPACELDFREGGRWRVTLRDRAEVDHVFSGEYREIVRADRIAFTERYEAYAANAHLVTLDLAEEGGVTTLSMHIRHQSVHERDAHLRSGMESGLQQMLARLDALVAPLNAASR